MKFLLKTCLNAGTRTLQYGKTAEGYQQENSFVLPIVIEENTWGRRYESGPAAGSFYTVIIINPNRAA